MSVKYVPVQWNRNKWVYDCAMLTGVGLFLWTFLEFAPSQLDHARPIDSAILRIIPHPDGPPLPPERLPAFFRVVRAGFSQPRKQIKNPLSAGLGIDQEAAVAALQRAGIDPRRRAETLYIADWLALYEAITGPTV